MTKHEWKQHYSDLRRCIRFHERTDINFGEFRSIRLDQIPTRLDRGTYYVVRQGISNPLIATIRHTTDGSGANYVVVRVRKYSMWHAPFYQKFETVVKSTNLNSSWRRSSGQSHLNRSGNLDRNRLNRQVAHWLGVPNLRDPYLVNAPRPHIEASSHFGASWYPTYTGTVTATVPDEWIPNY